MVEFNLNELNTLSILEDLVAFRSLTPDDAGSLDYIARIVTLLGGNFIRVDRNDTSNLIATIGSGNKVFAFAGHVDVVPTGECSLWQSDDPFELYQDGDKLIGRGVADMKGGIAAFLVAMIRYVNSHDMSNYKIMLAITSDEEGSALDGTCVMVDYFKQHKIMLDYCLVGEPSCTNLLGDTIKVGRRGSLTGNLTINGKQGHIAYPHLCQNPIHDFAPALAELSSKIWDSGNEYFPATSLQFANINSGLGVTNVIPGALTANFNFRYSTEQTAENLQNEVIKILDTHNLNYNIAWNHSAKPFITNDGDFMQIAESAIRKITGLTVAKKTDGGTSDGRFLIDVSEQIIELGLLNGTIHQINEFTTLSDINNLTKIYFSILEDVFN